MTSITLTITGAKARASVSGPLTSGMVGIPVILEYDDSWNGLTKNLVCRCGKWGPEKGETRTVLNIGERTTVAHEVMKSDMNLYLGVEGYSADGKLVIPSTWADCGKIQPGANTDADSSASPKLSIWGQLQTEINQLKTQTITEDQIAAGIAAYLEENPIEVPEVPQSSVLNASQITALDNMFKVCAFVKDDVSAEYAAFQTAFGISGGGDEEPDEPVNPDVTLSSISATYSGGDVAVGTAVTDLTGVVVTAHYSDGTSQTVTGYTLSGEITEGSNTVTVTYQGMTTTFIVTGVAETGEDTRTILYNWDFTGSEPLADKVSGTTATVNTGSPVIDSNGVKLASETDSLVLIPSVDTFANQDIEIDIGDISGLATAIKHLRLLIFVSSFNAGLICRNTTLNWSFYSNGGWTDGTLGQNGVSEKTVKLSFDDSNNCTAYVDGAEIIGSTAFTIQQLALGSTSNSALGVVVKAIRIYQREG